MFHLFQIIEQKKLVDTTKYTKKMKEKSKRKQLFKMFQIFRYLNKKIENLIYIVLSSIYKHLIDLFVSL